MKKPPRSRKAQDLRIVVYLVLALCVLVGLIVTIINPKVGMTLAALFILYIYAGCVNVGADEQAVMTAFGSPVADLSSGLHFAPPGMMKVLKFTTTLIQLDIGTTSTDHEGNPIEIGTVNSALYMRGTGEPQRITFAGRAAGDNNTDPLNDRLTCDPRIVASFEIAYPIVFKKTIGNITALVLKIEEIAVSALQELCATRTPAKALEDLPLLGTLITIRIEHQIGDREKTDMPVGASQRDQDIANLNSTKKKRSWGVNFLSLTIKTLGFPQRVNEAIADNNKEGFNRLAAITKSEGERQKRINEGEGTANARRALLFAEADGFAEEAIVAETEGGKFALRQATMAKTMETAHHTLIADPNSLLGAVAAVRETLQRVGGPERAQTQGQQGAGQQRQQPRQGQQQARPQRQQQREQRRGGGQGQGQGRQQNQPAQAAQGGQAGQLAEQPNTPQIPPPADQGIQAHGELVPPAGDAGHQGEAQAPAPETPHAEPPTTET